MIDLKILNFNRQTLADYIRCDAGSSSPDYFLCKTGGGLQLQQVPEEYAQLLLWFKSKQFHTYLELGIGRGGSFLLNTLFQSHLRRAVAVDNCQYWQQSQKDDIQGKVEFLKTLKSADVEFINSSTDDFFRWNTESFDCIFIDADHSYEGARKDYENALRFLNPDGYLIFHDVCSRACPGVSRLWSEVKNDSSLEFVASETCGIGIVRVGSPATSTTVGKPVEPRLCYCGSNRYFVNCHGDLGWMRQLEYLRNRLRSDESFLSKAFASAMRGNLPLADLLVRGHLAQDENDLDALLLLAEISLKLGMLSDASDLFRRACTIAEKHVTKKQSIESIETALALIDHFRSLSPTSSGAKKYLMIKSWGSEFWADIDHVVGQLLVAEITGRTPLVHWGRNSLFGEEDGGNAFELYFEPVSAASIDELLADDLSYYPPKWSRHNLLNDNNNKWSGPYCRQCGVMFLGRGEDVVVSDFHTPIAHLMPWVSAASSYRTMQWHQIYNQLFERYLRPNSRITKLVDEFFTANMAERSWLAICLQGGEMENEHVNLSEISNSCFHFIDKALAANKRIGVLLLTDSTLYPEMFKAKYGVLLPIINTHSIADNKLHGTGHTGRTIGDSAMLDCYLAIRCDFFIGIGESTVSTAIGSLKQWPEGSYALIGRDLRSNINISLHNW